MASETNGDTWEIRAARNQSVFRAVNERLKGAGSEESGETLAIACECANTGCTETVEIRRSDYERLRDHPNRFAVASGHVYADVEDVVETHQGFTVVAKRDEGAAVASALHSALGA